MNTPGEILDTILGYLGFAFEIEEQQRDGHPVLQIYTHDAELLTGHHLEVLDELQYLVNRLLQAADANAPRVTVDVEHHRAIRDDALVAKVRHLAEAVNATGRPIQTDPLNSYDRYIVHNTFKDDPEISTWSPKDDARVKRITLRKRRKDA
jgi:spoIIIJ-associated protein